MARKLGRLKAAQITKLEPGRRYHDGGGLYLVVGAGNARSWIFRFRKDGKLHDYGLGPAHTITLARARQRAAECRVALYTGGNPVTARKTARIERVLAAAKAITFAKAAEQYIESRAAGWRNGKSEQQWRQSLTDHVFPVFGNLPVQAIDVGLVMRAIEPLWTTKTETASRVRGRIESILDWAATRGYRQGDNPARWRGHLENLLPKRAQVAPVRHHDALPYSEIGAFMTELRRQEGIAARALEFAILTAARSGEVIGARWDEINVADRLWVVPASRMKAHKEHRVPLSDAAMAIVEAMVKVRTNNFVFPGTRLGRPIGPTALSQVLLRIDRKGLTTHGFRSTFRDWAAERTAFPAELAEMALAHQVGSAVERAYRRSDLMERRRQLLQTWATFCDAPPATGEVVPIGQARQPQQADISHHHADANAG